MTPMSGRRERVVAFSSWSLASWALTSSRTNSAKEVEPLGVGAKTLHTERAEGVVVCCREVLADVLRVATGCGPEGAPALTADLGEWLRRQTDEEAPTENRPA
jgi:hypothetical protein